VAVDGRLRCGVRLSGRVPSEPDMTDNINVSAIASRIHKLASDMPLRILIVDDDELGRSLLADRLLTCGFQVTTAASGREALEVLERQAFPVILTDWQMPEMSGIELTEQLRARGNMDTYVIMLTVRDSESDYECGYLAGADDYLSKKAPNAQLLARIHAAFETFRLRKALAQAQSALAESLNR
jgi:DNA-binding response OmpR family regulator